MSLFDSGFGASENHVFCFFVFKNLRKITLYKLFNFLVILFVYLENLVEIRNF